MLWLVVALISYFLLAAVHIVDKYLLGERIPSPLVFAFYMGMLGTLAFLLAPFGFLRFPGWPLLFLAVVAGGIHILAVLSLLWGQKLFETSRIVPAIGALLPIFTFGFTLLFGKAEKVLGFYEILAFLLLILGTVLITYRGKGLFSWKSLRISALSAFLFATFFIMMKFVYLSHPFLSAMIWSRLGAFLVSLLFLFSATVRKDIFEGPKIAQGKTWMIVLPNEALVTVSIVLQNWAIALAPFAFLGIINALEGIKYFFLIFFAAILSVKFPQILKEEISRKVIIQKILAVLLLGAGLAILALK